MAQDKAKALVDLARQEFDDLSPAEEAFFQAVANGKEEVLQQFSDASVHSVR